MLFDNLADGWNMIEFLQHLFGLCPDHAAHFNFLDTLFATGGLGFIGYGYYWVRGKIKSWKKQ